MQDQSPARCLDFSRLHTVQALFPLKRVIRLRASGAFFKPRGGSRGTGAVQSDQQ